MSECIMYFFSPLLVQFLKFSSPDWWGSLRNLSGKAAMGIMERASKVFGSMARCCDRSSFLQGFPCSMFLPQQCETLKAPKTLSVFLREFLKSSGQGEAIIDP